MSDGILPQSHAVIAQAEHSELLAARDERDRLRAELTTASTEAAKLLESAKLMGEMHHDLLVVMQATLIEWKHGKGAEAGLRWIVNTLDGPGLLPQPSEPYGTEAQAYFDANKAKPFPTCFCGRPSNQLWMSQGFCSEAHYREARVVKPAGSPA